MSLDPDRNQLERYYRNLLETHGLNEKALGWTKSKQVLRFASATKKESFLGTSVLDVGCGLGDFFHHLQTIGQSPAKYTGYDLVEEFIDAASRTHASPASFKAQDFFEENLDPVDHIVAFGIFNHLAGRSEIEGEKRLSSFLSKAVTASRKSVIVDFLSDKVDFRRNPTLDRHWNPGRVLDLAMEHSRAVTLDHGYLPFEFMIVITPDVEVDTERAVFRHKGTSKS